MLRHLSSLQGLEGRLRQMDPQRSGMMRKGDFINAIFDVVAGSIPASELIQCLNLFAASFDDVLNYEEFLRLCFKANDPGHQDLVGHSQEMH